MWIDFNTRAHRRANGCLLYTSIRSHIGLLADRMAELRRQLNTAVSTEAALTNQLEFKRQLSAKNTESDQKLAEEEKLLKDEAAAEQQQLSDLNKQRQRLSEESKQLSAVVNENEQQLRQLNNQIQEAAAAVSYTHLDVYKRQVTRLVSSRRNLW